MLALALPDLSVQSLSEAFFSFSTAVTGASRCLPFSGAASNTCNLYERHDIRLTNQKRFKRVSNDVKTSGKQSTTDSEAKQTGASGLSSALVRTLPLNSQMPNRRLALYIR